MASKHTLITNLKGIGRPALAVAGILILVWSLEGAASQISTLAGCCRGEGLGILRTAVLAAWQALQGYAPVHHGALECLVHMLTSFLPLILSGVA